MFFGLLGLPVAGRGLVNSGVKLIFKKRVNCLFLFAEVIFYLFHFGLHLLVLLLEVLKVPLR